MNSVIESSFAVDSMFALDNTLPSPTNLTNPDVLAKMLASQSNAGFHDYATTQKPVTSLPDHSLQTDMRTLSSSPSSLSIYEPAFGGGLDDDSCANLDDIDIKPLTDLSGTSFENDVLLTDHLFGSDVGLGAPVAFPGGPTLAALNLDIGDDNMENSTIDNTNIEKYMLSQENSKLMWSQNAPLLSPTDAFPVTNHTEAAKNDAMSILKASSRPAAPLATHQPQTTSVPTTVWGQNSTITITTAAPINSTTPATTTQIINIAPAGYVADTAVQIQTDQKLKELGSNRLKIDGKHLLKALGTLTSSPMASFNLNTVAVKQEVVSLVPSGTVCVSAESVPVGATVVKKEEPACQVNSDAWQTISLNSIKPEPQHAVIKTEPEDMEMESDDSEGELSDDDDVSGDDEPFQIQMSQFNNSIEDLLMQDDFSANGTKKERRFFWQYNTQSKGPKGKRLCKSMLSEDPYNLSDFADPVFDPELNQSRYKHSGKARKGDGNDIKPSPNRLLQLGTELYTLNKQIGSFPPVNELPTKERGKSRREKNKLASRACRLKKKAQNEANKIMLNGLGQEHVRLKTVILNVKKALRRRVAEMRSGQPAQPGQEKLMTSYNKLFNSHLKHMVAGNTALYVNAVLMKAAGVKGPDDI